MGKGKKMNCNDIKLWFIDVDGTLTDSGIYYDEFGNELKKFSTKDAAGIFAVRYCGMKVIVLTGRECKATQRRLTELGVDLLVQNCKDKEQFIRKYLLDSEIEFHNVGYLGDDLNDYVPMSNCGFKACPADACMEIKSIVDYISPIAGGHGAVRDILESFLRKNGKWEDAIKYVYRIGV